MAPSAVSVDEVYLHRYQIEKNLYYIMELNFSGIILAACTFVIIGVFHAIVIKTEYHTGTRLWWAFLLAGIVCFVAALFIANIFVSALFGVLGATCLWSIGELFQQKKRVKKGWFPKNPNREYK